MITVLKGDLVGLGLDLVVNEANTELLPGAGICRRIFEAAGRVWSVPVMKQGAGNSGMW